MTTVKSRSRQNSRPESPVIAESRVGVPVERRLRVVWCGMVILLPLSPVHLVIDEECPCGRRCVLQSWSAGEFRWYHGN